MQKSIRENVKFEIWKKIDAGKGFDENEINFKGKIAVLEVWFKDKSANNIWALVRNENDTWCVWTHIRTDQKKNDRSKK